jgi:hypothetical protein
MKEIRDDELIFVFIGWCRYGDAKKEGRSEMISLNSCFGWWRGESG